MCVCVCACVCVCVCVCACVRACVHVCMCSKLYHKSVHCLGIPEDSSRKDLFDSEDGKSRYPPLNLQTSQQQIIPLFLFLVDSSKDPSWH